VGSLIGAGLVVESLREYPCIAWKHMPYMTEDDEGMWRMPAGAGDIPLLFSVTARRPKTPSAVRG
jgi:hypothetical protein